MRMEPHSVNGHFPIICKIHNFGSQVDCDTKIYNVMRSIVKDLACISFCDITKESVV